MRPRYRDRRKLAGLSRLAPQTPGCMAPSEANCRQRGKPAPANAVAVPNWKATQFANQSRSRGGSELEFGNQEGANQESRSRDFWGPDSILALPFWLPFVAGVSLPSSRDSSANSGFGARAVSAQTLRLNSSTGIGREAHNCDSPRTSRSAESPGNRSRKKPPAKQPIPTKIPPSTNTPRQWVAGTSRGRG